VDFDEFYLWYARQDADAFAHLMSRGAHRQVVGWGIALGLAIFLPLIGILVISGPDPTVRALFCAHCCPTDRSN
jgi:hypothetical protein